MNNVKNYFLTSFEQQSEMISLLEFQMDAGYTTMLENTPINRLEPILPSPTPSPSQPHIAHAQPVSSCQTATKIAKDLAYRAQSLDELYKAMMNFDDCRLKKTATHTVFSDGNPKTDIMFIGEAPGKEEDKQGKPFVGRSGKLLDKMMSYIGLNRSNIYITNVIPWRPPANRPPTPEEITICEPFLRRHIELINPKILILIGNISTKTLLKTSQGITKLRGELHYYQPDKENIPSLPMLHPSYLLRTPIRKQDAWKDFLMLKQYIEKYCLTIRDI